MKSFKQPKTEWNDGNNINGNNNNNTTHNNQQQQLGCGLSDACHPVFSEMKVSKYCMRDEKCTQTFFAVKQLTCKVLGIQLEWG